ncbi:hypothetical protein EHP00_1268 [Ecytonucleospora hepatopenaei]|uniref:Homologous-pairing protein 2 winged helix domain-containing protein n=1 Tax=Ecytonucleospora hepatopenaei TaxID=646526 RepID=A0A1W0E6E3_9MICR|nr:hypothetical protein EHP00_1268 [Ecytonucleospora hepatopenaei]
MTKENTQEGDSIKVEIKRKTSKNNKKKKDDFIEDSSYTQSESISEEKPKKAKKASKTKKEPAKKKKATGTKDEAYRKVRDELYSYFYYSNKPVVMTELNLIFKDVSKKLLETICDDLEEKKVLSIKLNGKTKVYFLNQKSLSYIKENIEIENENNNTQGNITENTQGTMQKMSCSVDVKKHRGKTLKELEEEWKIVEEQNKQLIEENNQLKEEKHAIGSALSDEEMQKQTEEFKEFLEENKKYTEIELADEKTFDSLKVEENLLKKTFISRKKIFKNITETVSEGMNKKVKEFLEEVGLNED